MNVGNRPSDRTIPSIWVLAAAFVEQIWASTNEPYGWEESQVGTSGHVRVRV